MPGLARTTLTLERPDPDVVTVVIRSADLLREGRELLLDLVDRAEVRDAAVAWTGRVNSVIARRDRVDVDALLIRLDGCVAWPCLPGQDLDATTLVRALGTWVRPTGLSGRINGRLRFARYEVGVR